MSCECRCDDIKRYNEEIQKINSIYMQMNNNFINISVMDNNAKKIEEEQPNSYEAANKMEVSMKIGKVTYSLKEQLRETLYEINKEKDRLNRELSDLSSEDRKHHEEEARKRERGFR